MKKLYSCISTFLFCLLCLYSPLSLALAAQDNKVIILYTNDVHSAIDEGLSYAGVAAHKKQLQSQYGEENVVLVDAGDAIQGRPLGLLTKGGAIVDMLNTVGYDYMTLGNHEFDYGMPRLFELIQKLQTQVISCNITSTKDASPIFPPYALREFHGMKVAFVGITTPESITKSTPAYFQDEHGTYIYSFAEGHNGQDLYDIVQKTVHAARAEGAEIVIALVHLGIDEEASPWTSPELIQHTQGIDVLIDGHSHSAVQSMYVKNALGNEVLLTQAGSHLRYLGQLTLDTVDRSTKSITSTLHTSLPSQDALTAQRIQNLQKDLDSILEKKVASTAFPLITTDTKGQNLIRLQETNLGNLVADAHRSALDTDVALINGGGIAHDIDTGDITYKEIIRVLPYANEAVCLQVSGQALWDALEMGARHLPKSNGGFMHVSGMTYTIDSTLPSSVMTDDKGNFISVAGAYRVKDVRIQGKALQPQAMYSMASSAYIALHSGDGMTMFRGATRLKDVSLIDNEILFQYIVQTLGGQVGAAYANAQGEGRITILR